MTANRGHMPTASENTSGAYFWATDAVIVRRLDEAHIRMAIADLIRGGVVRHDAVDVGRATTRGVPLVNRVRLQQLATLSEVTQELARRTYLRRCAAEHGLKPRLEWLEILGVDDQCRPRERLRTFDVADARESDRDEIRQICVDALDRDQARFRTSYGEQLRDRGHRLTGSHTRNLPARADDEWETSVLRSIAAGSRFRVAARIQSRSRRRRAQP